jgi:hypothetical protein
MPRAGPSSVSDWPRRWHRREAMALKGLYVPGHPLPLLLVNAPEPLQEGQGFVLAVERGRRGDDDAAALDEARASLLGTVAKLPARPLTRATS